LFDHKHYVPILTAKRGEYRALLELTPQAKSRLTPMLEIPPIEWDFENEEPDKTIDQQVGGAADLIDTHWGASQRAFIDLFHVSSEGPLQNGVHALSHVLAEARQKQLKLVPVTGLERSAPYQIAVRDAAAIDHRGICLRVTTEQISRIADMESEIAAVLAELNITSRGDVDLVIDFGPMDSMYVTTYRLAAVGMLHSFPAITEWRSLTLTGSSFPQNMSGIAPDSIQQVTRGEWQVWKHVIAQSIPRIPTFGDYGIGGPEYVNLDWRVIKRSANVRYAHNETWFIVKGHVIKKNAPNQMPGLAQQLIALPQYCGPNFSSGDQYAWDCAHGTDGPGSATTWRQVGTNHHLTFVVNQIANYPWP
jgi:hypothetical protein